MTTTQDTAGKDVYVSGAGEPVARRTPPGQPGRTSQEIRANIEDTRVELGRSVELLRSRVAELTDWRRHVREHRNELIAGAAVAGFVIGGIAALRRRRR
jgi:antitoxin (DNA-binding transcriptional repressor) of toxin-antitoxin stability system